MNLLIRQISSKLFVVQYSVASPQSSLAISVNFYSEQDNQLVLVCRAFIESDDGRRNLT